MIKIYKYGTVSNDEIFARNNPTGDVSDIVKDIIENVKANGDKALKEYALKFDKAELENRALEFDRVGYALNHFPHGNGLKEESMVEIANKAISMQAFKKSKDGGYILRLFNGNDVANQTTIRIENINTQAKLEAFEVKTFRYFDDILTECEGMEV